MKAHGRRGPEQRHVRRAENAGPVLTGHLCPTPARGSREPSPGTGPAANPYASIDDAKKDPDAIVIYTSSDGEDGMLLAATLNAAGTARRYTTSMLTKWGILDYEDDVHLLVTELITNAIKVTGIPIPDPTYGQIYRYAKPISLSLYRHGDLLVIEVWDTSRKAPKRHHPADDEEGGRGIMVIEGIAEAWGYRWPKTGGKVVWTSIKVAPASQLQTSVYAVP